MSMLAQLLSPAPPLPPVYPPGQNGNVFRSWFDGDRYTEMIDMGKRFRDSTEVDRKKVKAFIKRKKECTFSQIESATGIQNRTLRDYIGKFEHDGFCTVDRSKRPAMISAK